MAENEETTGGEFREKFEDTLSENRKLKLELAVARAGIDTESALGAMFVENLANRRDDLDVAEIREQWQAIAGSQEPVEVESEPALDPTLQEIYDRQNAALQRDPAVPGVSAEALQSLQLADRVADSSTSPRDRQDLSAHEAARLAMETEAAAGMDRTTQEAAYFGTLFSRAAGGDPSAIWTAEKWNDKLREHGELPA